MQAAGIASIVQMTIDLNCVPGDKDFMEWMSALDPVLLSQYPALSQKSQSKLKSLFTLYQENNAAVEEVTQNINRCEQEFNALDLKICGHLEQLGVNDDDFFSYETEKMLQESARMLLESHIGDGTDIGSTVTLAKQFLIASSLSRKRLCLAQDINVIQGKNNKLRATLKFLKREAKLSSEEVADLHSKLGDELIELDFSQKKANKFGETFSATRAELDLSRKSSAISDESILNLYKKSESLSDEIFQLEKKLQQFDELPANIPEAVKVIQTTKEHLASVMSQLKVKLTAGYA